MREVDEAMRTHTALQRATHSESWQEADRTRQRATTEPLKAMAVLDTTMAQTQRELKEEANLPAGADAVIQLAQEELRCAQAIRSELLLLGKEALNELDAPPYVPSPVLRSSRYPALKTLRPDSWPTPVCLAQTLRWSPNPKGSHRLLRS